jgi:hypothetical protein
MPATEELSPAEQAALRARCSVFLAGHGQVTPADLLAGIPASTVTDRYGDGGVFSELEAEIAGLLGKPAAVFLRVVPDPPQVPMMHLLLDTAPDKFAAAARHLAAEQGIWAWPNAMTTIDPHVQRVEFSVGDATCTLEPDRIRDIIAALIGR